MTSQRQLIQHMQTLPSSARNHMNITAMTFNDWYNEMEDRYNASYDGYKELLQECWEAAQKTMSDTALNIE